MPELVLFGTQPVGGFYLNQTSEDLSLTSDVCDLISSFSICH